MSSPAVQLLLAGRPICTKCMHGNSVEVITGRANSPVEYHCGYCGNYAIVGVPARFPFMVAVKAEKQPDIGISASARPDNTGSSPLQVGESLRKKEECMSIHVKCKHPGCDKLAAVAGYCNIHFKGLYGITAEQYRAEKRDRKEDPETVAERVREYSLAASKARMERAKETFRAALDEEKEKSPAASPAASPAPPKPYVGRLRIGVEADPVDTPAFVVMLLAKYPAYDAGWPLELRQTWFDGFNRILALVKDSA